MEERGYQLGACAASMQLLRSGRRTLLVAPTGAGKTCMGTMIVRDMRAPRTFWVVHTRDLVRQTAKKLELYGLRAGIIAGNEPVDPFAPIQVVSIQTLIARDAEYRCELVVLDEAHHYMAEDWRAAWERLGAKQLLGLTATPERGDGKPLGDIFDDLVVAAHYSDLIRMGHLVPLRILRPKRELERGVARSALDAYMTHARGQRAFLYARSIELAAKAAANFTEHGVPAAIIEHGTKATDREGRLEAFARGDLHVLTNQRVLTEGVDIPAASVCIWEKNFSHLSGALQSAGRVLRPHPGKTEALLLDLPGLTHRPGWIPTEDKEYSLRGNGISQATSKASLTVCMNCGMTHESGVERCPRCGFVPPKKQLKPMRIFNEELQAVFAGGQTPDWAKKAELDRLLMVMREKKLSFGFVQAEYARLFGEPANLGGVDSDAKRAEYDKLKDQGEKSGHHRGWAMHRYRARFGAFPPRSWG